MKKVILIVAALISIYSCTKESDEMAKTMEHTGKWELVRMTGSFVGQESTGADMQWQETYVINEDETFSKKRVRGDSTILASGTYQLKVVEEIGDRATRTINIELLYNFENNIIGDCSPDKIIERLYISSDHKLKNTWNQCDGPGMEYLKSK